MLLELLLDFLFDLLVDVLLEGGIAFTGSFLVRLVSGGRVCLEPCSFVAIFVGSVFWVGVGALALWLWL